MTRRSIAVSVALLSLLVAPSLATAQAPRGAGIVTTLAGSATVARATAPQPLPLRFKDDVFLRDRISTAEESLVRVLLGGKAVVTVRERSTLTVTEEVGRSTVDLDAGKVGLAVARERMRPGEVIDIRTPNAIVAVRGSVLFVETIVAAGVPPVTNVDVVKGSAEVLLKTAIGVTPTIVGPGLSISVVANAIGQLRPNPPNVIDPKMQARPPHNEPAAEVKQALAAGEVTTATALATTLAGGAPLQPAVRAPLQPAATGNVARSEVISTTRQDVATLTSTITPTTPTTPTAPPTNGLPGGITPPAGFVPTGGLRAIPGSGDIHMMLTWGPANDIDLHANVFTASGSIGHVFFGNRGSLTGSPFTQLNQDCICQNGSEVITIRRGGQTHLYFVSAFNFGNPSQSSTQLSTTAETQAQLIRGGTVGERPEGGSIVTGGTVVQTLRPPAGQPGNTWVINAVITDNSGDFAGDLNVILNTANGNLFEAAAAAERRAAAIAQRRRPPAPPRVHGVRR